MSIAYQSSGHRRYNQPFAPSAYGPEYVQGDVVGVGYRPRTGTLFFTRNGKKLDDVAHGLKTPNFFPTVGANGPCSVHVNFGQSGFVFIEANVKKWGLAPTTGSLAPPPPYGSEQGSILLEAGGGGGENPPNPQAAPYLGPRHVRGRSRYGPAALGPTSPGPVRSPTDISLAQLVHVPSHEDAGEGSSQSPRPPHPGAPVGLGLGQLPPNDPTGVPPPEYSSPQPSPDAEDDGPERRRRRRRLPHPPSPPRQAAPSYEVAMGRDARRGSDGGPGDGS